MPLGYTGEVRAAACLARPLGQLPRVNRAIFHEAFGVMAALQGEPVGDWLRDTVPPHAGWCLQRVRQGARLRMIFSRILVRATNWVGDAVISLPALRALRDRFPQAQLDVLARPWVADLYARESCCHRLIPYAVPGGWEGWRERWKLARELRRDHYDCALLLTNSFETALFARMAGIPARIGYDRNGRGFLLTQPVTPPAPGEIPAEERYYYLELLRRAGFMSEFPAGEPILLEGTEEAAKAGTERFRAGGIALPVIGVSPGATNSRAKQWLPERFAASACRVAAELSAAVVLFGSDSERAQCEHVAGLIRQAGYGAHNLAGATCLSEFIELAAACRVFITNDSGAMHVASACGVPTVAIYGPTNELATPPSGPRTAVVREPVECMRCMFRDCPIDHRCMTLVSAERVAKAALELVK